MISLPQSSVGAVMQLLGAYSTGTMFGFPILFPSTIPVILQDSGEGFEDVAQNSIEDMNARAAIRESEPLESTTQVRYVCSLGYPPSKPKKNQNDVGFV